jgi:glycosyltransferase involved in cell wall biosynthesis
MNSYPRIAILPQGGDKWIAGINYSHNLIRALHHLPPDERPRLDFFFGPADDLSHHQELGALHPSRFYYCFRKKTRLYDKVYDAKQSLLRLRWPRSLEGLAADLRPKAVFPAQGSLGGDFPVPWIGWIPDFQHKLFPQFFQKEELDRRDMNYERLLNESWHTVVSSRESYQDLTRFFPGFGKKTSVLSFCTVPDETWYHVDPRLVVKKFGLPDKFLIFPSQFWMHKNHGAVLKALAILKDKGFPDVALVCTGFTQDIRRPEYFDSLKKFIEDNDLSKNVFILGLLPRLEQIQLMRAAAAVLQPSYFEGWSSLVEDARVLGKRIFVSDIPIHREQDPPDACFFPPDDAPALADRIAREWIRLQPGPDIGKEKVILKDHRPRVEAFARTFLGIVEQAAQKRG